MKGDSENVGEMEDTPTEMYQSLHRQIQVFHWNIGRQTRDFKVKCIVVVVTSAAGL